MIHGKTYDNDDPELSRDSLTDIMIPCYCGLTVPNRKLFRIMGRDEFGLFLKDREIYYNEWRFKQLSSQNFPI